MKTEKWKLRDKGKANARNKKLTKMKTLTFGALDSENRQRKISVLDDSSIEISLSEMQREKRMQSTKQDIKVQWDSLTMYVCHMHS